MLDNTETVPTTANWQETLQRGDVVLFAFPVAEDGEAAKPKTRPCLVLEVEERSGVRFAILAYGTSSPGNRGYDIRISREAGLAAAGLRKATHFVGARRVIVALDHPGFATSSSTGSPLIGRLCPLDLERMNAVRAKIHALQDIARDRREARRRRGTTTREIIVEYRRSRRIES